jgi:hypothetical protein
MNISKPKLPPGPSYIICQILSRNTAIYALFVALIHVTADLAGIYAPAWAIVVFSIIALPAVFYTQSELRYWSDKRTATALGARLAPKMAGKRLFGMDLIAFFLEAQKTGYMGGL